MAYVYKHTRLDTNEVFYIGIATTKHRPYNTKSRSKWWKRVVDKADYIVDIIYDNITYSEAIDTEKYLIKYYGRKDLGLGELVNMTDGGEGSLGIKISEETRQILKDNAIKNEIHKNFGDCSGSNNSFYGKNHSEEAKHKMSIAKKGRKAWNKGVSMTDEAKQKLKDTLRKNKLEKYGQ